MDNDLRMKHESYGALEITRCQRPPTSLFCSSIQHENTIRLRISAAELHRNQHTHTDLMYALHAKKDCYVEVEMSQTQFAEAITSLNKGGGTPVTVRYANGREMQPCPYERKDEQFRAEFSADLEELATKVNGAVKRAEALFSSKKPLTKSEKEEILSVLGSLSMAVNSNIPYVRDAFVKQMDKVVTEAKGNIEGFIQNRMDSLANAAIADALGKGSAEALLGMGADILQLDSSED